jgi:hypothetical protein
LEPQRGESSFSIMKKKKKSMGGGIDMSTNVDVLELVPG